MPSRRSPVADFAVYAILRLLEFFGAILPPHCAMQFVRCVARLAYAFDRRRRDIALDNLRKAFPNQFGERQLQRIVLDVYRHFSKLMLELALWSRKGRGSRWWRETAADVSPRAHQILALKRPFLCVTAHYGNWEIGAFQMRTTGVRTYAVARPLDNAFLDARLRRFRESCGNKVLSKRDDLYAMHDVLASGGVLSLLGDQDAGRQGIFVDFFGRPACTHRVMALLSQWTDAVVVVTGNRSKGPLLQYEAFVMDIIDPRDYGDDRNAVQAITQRVTSALERLIRSDPRQYLWLHRRWKHQPKAKAAAMAA